MVAVKASEPQRDHDAERRRDARHEEPEPQLGDPCRQPPVRVPASSATRPANKGDVKAQTAESLARIGRTLKAAGFDWKNVVDGVVYLPDLTKFNDMNTSYREASRQGLPRARDGRRRPDGPDAAVEIMLTAVK